jgi:hypothetical protein
MNIQRRRDLNIQVWPETFNVTAETLTFSRHTEEVNDKSPLLLFAIGTTIGDFLVIVVLKG